MRPMPGTIRAYKEGSLGWIEFDHPERRNAISAEMWRCIPSAASDLDEDPEVRVVVLRGSGDVAFAAGADISEFGKNRTGENAREYDRENGRAMRALAEIRKPVIAAIHGFCVGGGCAVALTADLRYAADDGVFAIPAARLGLGYGADGIATLIATVGLPAAREIFFTGRRFNAREALEMGLVNRVFPKTELDERVRETAESIAANAPLTLASAKLAMKQLSRDPTERDLEAVEASIAACYASDDYAEGVKAFLEKRPPNFRGS